MPEKNNTWFLLLEEKKLQLLVSVLNVSLPPVKEKGVKYKYYPNKCCVICILAKKQDNNAVVSDINLRCIPEGRKEWNT